MHSSFENYLLSRVSESNLPPQNTIINQKKFSKAYKECARDVIENHKYIINFDGYTLAEKRSLLSSYMDVATIEALTPDTVNSLFTKRVRHLIRDLEEDIRDNS